MVREDLIEGAVTFLQDPSVASAPLEQKLAFLRSKNLTQEEIDASLTRAGQSPTSQSTPPSNYPQQYRQPPSQYGGYQQVPPWAQAPPEPPRRDWRDWFIMATVIGGAGYAAYWTAKRYIVPLIAPPTPPQLEQDKASIDASFDKAFALLDQLATDTQELKDAENARKERLDSALGEVESVIAKMKEAGEARESEAKRMAKEMLEVREQIPQAIQREKEATEERLKELATEMRSLKTLVGNRMSQPLRPSPTSFSQGPNGINVAAPSAPVSSPGPTVEANGINGTHEDGEGVTSLLTERSPSTSYGRIIGGSSSGKAQIPAWQLAAKKKKQDAKQDEPVGLVGSQDLSESGTVTEGDSGS